MGDVENIISLILSTRPDLSREIISEMLEKARKKAGGLISDDVLLHMIATDLGVKISPSRPSTGSGCRPLISCLVSGLNDVTVAGRVLAVFPATSSETTKFSSLLIADGSGILRVVMWNDKAELVNSGAIRFGQIVRLVHGYTKEGRFGRVELHMSGKGTVEVDPPDLDAKDYPTLMDLSTKIGALNASFRNKRVNLIGSVKDVLPASSFKRQDSSTGRVMRFILADETGEVPIVVWNRKVDEAESIVRKGAKICIVNAKVKKALDEGFEAHVDSETYIGSYTAPTIFFKIRELGEGMDGVSVMGKVTVKPIIREVKTSRNETLRVAVFEIEDETGRIWVSAWRKNAEIAAKLQLGETVAIENAYVKKGFGDQPEISTRNATILKVIKSFGD
jgi:replication factor A1